MVQRLFQRRDLRYLLIASRGSSSNVARYAQYLLGRAHRVPVMFATPSLYTIYNQPPRLDGALAIGISQSGASPDVVAVLAEAREQGRPTLALTNDVESPLAKTAEVVLPLEAGEEHAVAATKTYVNSLGAVALLFAEMSNDTAARDELSGMPDALARQIELSLDDPPPLDEYRDAVGCYLGELFARNFGGEWVPAHALGPAIRLTTEKGVKHLFPLGWVYRRADGGAEESIARKCQRELGFPGEVKSLGSFTDGGERVWPPHPEVPR